MGLGAELTANLLRAERVLDLVILHDGIADASRTLAALEGILSDGAERGLRFVTVGRLLASAAPPGFPPDFPEL